MPSYLRRGLIPVVGILGQRLEHDSVEVGGDAFVPLRRRDGVFPNMLVGNGHRRVAGERRFAREDFVENAAQRVHIGTCVDGLAAGLLRRQILRGADHRGSLGDAVAAVGDRAGDAKVHHLDRIRGADHDVGRLDVSMDDAVLVAEVQRLARVGDDLDGPARWQGAVGVHDVAQGDTVDVLHDDVGQRAGGRLGLASVVDGDDGRVIQCGGVLRLAPEAEVKAGVAGQIRAQHLDRDIAMQSDVAGQVNLGHTPEAEDFAQFIAVGQVLRRGHCDVPCRAGTLWKPEVPIVPASGQLIRISGRAPAPLGVLVGGGPEAGGVPVSVTVGGCCCWSARELMTMSTAMMIASAPSTPAAHNSAR